MLQQCLQRCGRPHPGGGAARRIAAANQVQQPRAWRGGVEERLAAALRGLQLPPPGGCWHHVAGAPRRLSQAAAVGSTTPSGEAGSELASLLALLEELRTLPAEAPQPERLEAANAALQRAVVDWPVADRLALIKGMAKLGALAGRPYAVGNYFLMFLEEYGPSLGALRDGETVVDRALELREVLNAFHLAGIGTERLRLIHEHVEQEFPRFEAAGALLPMSAAVQLCHTMLATGQSSSGAIIVLLRSALREPLITVADDANELRQLKMIEILIRLDYLHTQEKLPRDVSEYLSVIRDLRFYDRAIRKDTALSYQLAYFLRKHGFPSKRHMLGPYALKVCDPEERINFEPLEERTFRPGMTEEPPARRRRHLEAVGWRTFDVHAAEWEQLGTYEKKAAHVRALLKENDLLSM